MLISKPEILILDTHVSHLPGDFHGDPADRMIVATARKLDGTLVTFDQKILEYSNNGYVQVLKRVDEDS
ncbi:MAG: hypothetical protein GTO45_31580 [Candidatus Aminicenantes bacterium]|nr:hypothetical protein [Candidatus Aminicenantes bacterium]NIM80616.1 hypothetical protein [Candidatus Aminicenantes bacterium]NIN19997.1 hypothetical protein [Candidatus Aminicenantes bacterium]NIN47975.1 hypothetical protein [Candidatus Aminicenantes bacterium]NIN89321.1 hypothetical protein [Candidatus Aminicenantes bacterium]